MFSVNKNRSRLKIIIIYVAFYNVFLKKYIAWTVIHFRASSTELNVKYPQSFGSKPSSQDLLERGSQCPICQDSVTEPVMLACKVSLKQEYYLLLLQILSEWNSLVQYFQDMYYKYIFD